MFLEDQDYGYRDESSWGGDDWHNGIDFSNYPGGSGGIPIQTIASGTVILRGYDYYLGNIVKVDHGGGLVSWYCHMQYGSHTHLSQGQPINQGDRVGNIGDTGASSDGNHLHLEIHVGGSRVDPQAFIRNNLGTGPGNDPFDEGVDMLLIHSDAYGDVLINPNMSLRRIGNENVSNMLIAQSGNRIVRIEIDNANINAVISELTWPGVDMALEGVTQFNPVLL